MKKIKAFILGLGILFGFQTISAQSANNPVPDWVRANQEARDRLGRYNRDVLREVTNKMPRTRSGRPKTREERRAEEKEAQAMIEEINRQTAPPDVYLSAYADFLKEKNTGIVRLFPDTNCGKGLTVTVTELERCSELPAIFGAGSLYSTRLSEIPSNLPLPYILGLVTKSEIHFVGGRLVVGNALTQGIISRIGEADLAAVDLKSDAFKFLKNYEKADKTSELAQKNAELEKGIESGGFLYSTGAAVKLDSVYVLRSIAYWQENKTFWNTDIFVAFKIIGQEKDGSIIFIWKKLKDKDAPGLVDD
jgi:hypothetical protein